MIRGGTVSHRDTEGDGGGGTSPPCTEGRIKNIRIWHTLLYYIISLGYSWNRVAGGELLYSSLHRGSTQCEAFGSFSVETAVKQPALSPLFRPHPNHRKKVQSNAKLRYSLCIPSVKRRACPAASVPLCVSVRDVSLSAVFPLWILNYKSIFFSKHTRFTCPMPLNTQGVMPISL